MATTTKVNVPKDAGDEIVVRYSGGDPVTYKVRDGHVTVDNENVDAFLRAIAGSEASTGNAGTSDKGES